MDAREDIADGCLEADLLLDFVDGRADAVTRSQVEDHASRCGVCREVLSSLARDGTPPIVPRGPALVPGTLLGRYVVAEPLGAGGMGVVYAAHDPELDRAVAVKVLRGEGTPELRDRLRREAQAMARLAHPHVVAVYDAGTALDRMFVAMELVAGETLAHWLATPRPIDAIVAAFRDAGRGLAAAHAVGIVHGDFKPENVLVGGDGRIRVGDFGLARGETDDGGARRQGGTPAFMAPEVHRGEAADARSDQFSFCVALFTALHGERPFTGDSLAALAASVQAGLQDAPRNPRVPRRIRTALLRGLAVDPAARFVSVRALLDELAPPRSRSHWLVGGAGLAAAATLGALLIARPAASDDEPCGGGRAAFSAVWSPQRKASLATAFTATRIPYATVASQRVGAALDRYAETWATAYGEACRATRVTGAQSEALLDLRMGCLERRRQEADALVTALAAPRGDTIERAVTAAYGLVDVAGCADIAALQERMAPPADPVARARLAVLGARLADVRARFQTGGFRAALAPTRAVVHDAQTLGYLPFVAEAASLEAAICHALGDPAGEQTAVDAALWAAEAGRHDDIAASAWIRQIVLAGYEGGDVPRAQGLVPRATAAIARLPHPATAQARLELALGAIDFKQGKLASAAAHETAALALAERVLGPGDLELARALEALGSTLAQQGEVVRGVRLLERARQVYIAALGTEHPWVAGILHNLGTAHLRTGDLATAETELRHAVAIRETLGPEYPELSGTLTALALVLQDLDRLGEAVPLHRRAVAIADRAWGPDGLQLLAPLIYEGAALGHANDFAAAEAAFDRAEAIATKALGARHPYAMVPTLGKADLRSDQGKWREAAALYERVIAAFAGAPEAADDLRGARARLARAYIALGDPARAAAAIAPLGDNLEHERAPLRAEVELARAAIVWSHGERRAARALADRALIDFQATPSTRSDAARVERWLAGHPAR